MKVSRVIIILLILSLVEGKKSDRSETVIAEAINGILKTYFVNYSPNIDLVYFGSNREIEKLVNDILKVKPPTILMEVSEGCSKCPWKNRLNISSILLFESAQSFKKVVKGIKWLSNKEKRFAHLVYASGISTSDIEESIEDGFSIDKVEFLMNETKHSLDLVSSFMYTAEKCRSNQLQIINRFTKRNLTWESSNIYPKKYNSFHGCDVNIAAGKEPDDLFDVDVKEFYEVIAKKHNFTPNFLNTTLNIDFYLIDLYTELEAFNIDELNEKKRRNYTRLILPYFVTLVVVVPPGVPYSTLEKMFMMFDLETWTAITVTLFVGLAVIQIINLCSIKVQNFVYGKGIQTPTMNLANIFLTGAQTKVPDRKFSRFLFIIFITWSLIIRTCYQSKLFTFLQADLRRPGPKTLKDLGEGLYLGESVDDVEDIYENFAPYRNFEFGDPERKIFSFCNHRDTLEMLECLNIVSEPSNKAFTIVPTEMLSFVKNGLYRKGKPSYEVLERPYDYMLVGITFKSFSPFFEVISETANLMYSNGISGVMIPSRNILATDRKEEDEEIGPQVLLMEHLGVGFIACLISALISLIVFSIEWSYPRVKECIRIFRSNAAALGALLAYLKLRRRIQTTYM